MITITITINHLCFTQNAIRVRKWQEVVAYIETNKRNPSRYSPEERGAYFNWLRHNRKSYNAREMKEERMEMISELLELMEENMYKNQYA